MLGIKSKEIIKSENEITKSADPCRIPAGARGIQDPPGKRQAGPSYPAGSRPESRNQSGIRNPWNPESGNRIPESFYFAGITCPLAYPAAGRQQAGSTGILNPEIKK